jgi:S-adenosylmethionine:diacylglycerol 3-amino-3-carboxypropyl transferase
VDFYIHALKLPVLQKLKVNQSFAKTQTNLKDSDIKAALLQTQVLHFLQNSISKGIAKKLKKVDFHICMDGFPFMTVEKQTQLADKLTNNLLETVGMEHIMVRINSVNVSQLIKNRELSITSAFNSKEPLSVFSSRLAINLSL